MNDSNLTDKLFNLLRQFGVTWNTLNLAKHLVRNNVILNERLSLDDLKENMWVWNETNKQYEKVNYITQLNTYSFHWYNQDDINIENDELWRYKKESVE